MSLRTSRWFLLQNEQRRTSPSPFFLAIVPSPYLPSASYFHPFVALDHLVDDPILLGLHGAHDEVAVGVGLEALQGLARMVVQDLVQSVLDAQDLTRVDVDVRGLSAESTHR